MLHIFRATLEHASECAHLFNLYRVFYGQPGDLDRANAFITERLDRGDSLILVAKEADIPAVGFAQIYPTFTSIHTGLNWTLNDLFVDENHRKNGIGMRLIEAVKKLAVEENVLNIVLETHVDNIAAQRLYEKLGFISSADFKEYRYSISHPMLIDQT